MNELQIFVTVRYLAQTLLKQNFPGLASCKGRLKLTVKNSISLYTGEGFTYYG